MAVEGLKNGQVSTDDECEKKIFKDDFKDFGLFTWRSRLPFCIDMGSLEESQVWRNFLLFSLPTFAQIRDGTDISCIGQQILYHWAGREASKTLFSLHK